MKIRLNNRWKLWLLILGLALLVSTYYDEPGQATDVVAEATERHAGDQSHAARKPAEEIALDQLKQRRTVTASNDLFRSKSWYVAPPPAPVRAPPPPVAVAPPLPFTFMGKEQKANGQLTLFIADADRVYLVHGGETIANNYHVDGIENGKLAFTYLPMKTKQYLAFSGGQ